MRTVQQASGYTAVQVVQKVGRVNTLVKHLGTARSPMELSQLKEAAQRFIDARRIATGVLSLFDSRYNQSALATLLDRLRFTKVYDSVLYRFLSFFYRKIGFEEVGSELFRDLVIARIAEPASKRKTRDILEYRFGKTYALTTIYRTLRALVRNKGQESVEEMVFRFVTFALHESLTTLFFDVTTLYFETFDEDDTRKNGFSKDNKHQQPQIVVALTVTSSGIPLHLRMFEGNTFEGHTMLPCIEAVRKKHDLGDVVVVADSAMLSDDNLGVLETKRLRYIVGARLSSMKKALIREIHGSISRHDRAHIRLPLPGNRTLIVAYSEKRAHKDKRDREKQIGKAKELLKRPDKLIRRSKYLSVTGTRYRLNTDLIQKAEILEGLKGYVTNAPTLSDEEIIERYASLWKVEKAFRMSKTDLKARPIFHSLKESIEAHLLVVFVALVVSRYVEMVTNTSIQKTMTILGRIKEVTVEDTVSGEHASKFTDVTPEAKQLLQATDVWVT